MVETDINKTATPDTEVKTTAVAGTSTGTVKSFDTNKKFGFITQDDGKEVFMHQESLMDGIRVSTGDKVSFEVTENPKGLRAESVRKL